MTLYSCRLIFAKQRFIPMQLQSRPFGHLSNFDPYWPRNQKGDSHPINNDRSTFSAEGRPGQGVTEQQIQEGSIADLLDSTHVNMPLEDDQFWNSVEQRLQWLLQPIPYNPMTNYGSKNQKLRTCIQILDRLSYVMNRDAETTSSLLNGPVFWGKLETDLLNKILVHWKRQMVPDSHSNRKITRNSLPSPSQMAEKVDKYRWKCLVQPNATTFNILIHAMVRTEGTATAERYLERLLEVAIQEIPSTSEGMDEPFPAMVNTITISTVIQGWANTRQPEKAQYWLEQMVNGLTENSTSPCSLLGIRPNTKSFTFAMHGWAKNGEPEKAQELLVKLLELDREHGLEDLAPDRILFHTVLDAWSRVRLPEERNSIAPRRAEQLVKLMDDIAAEEREDREKIGGSVTNSMHPNMETWSKLVAIYARSSSNQYGPAAAEKLLLETEQEIGEIAPIVAVNRVLHGYAKLRKMEEAKRFLEARLEFLAQANSPNVTCYPDEITLNILLGGLAGIAKHDPDTPIRAQEWLDRLSSGYGIVPSVETYSNVLNIWSAYFRCRDNAAEKVEEILRHQVVDLYLSYKGSPSNQNYAVKHSGRNFQRRNDSVDDFTVCFNIVLRGWAIHASHHNANSAKSQYAVQRMLQLLHEFLLEEDDGTGVTPHGDHLRGDLLRVRARPTDVTFRTVLYGILDSSIPLKYERAQVIVELMDRYGFQLNPHDQIRLSHFVSKSDSS
ncbi:PPR: pentatricopeptide repeat domain containing protein [Nitzschia inconspicua]|uniref:PPR: pentatricopeptide repeat domain containing protein n=1 Tax=Nitzschia inconspicua TaxID=303405 RepID=A0A9K3LL28_9STRA|nr:PPR: pentatricopeptide repeat domain containing protein [Nitzschia inconspicua]